MTSSFTRPALICNTQSGSHDAAVREQIAELCRAHNAPLVATFALPDGDIPDADALKQHGIDLLLVWTGDGTINAAATKAAGWDGAILALPGGTLNLLSKALHGDRPAPDILSDVLQGNARRSAIPTVQSDTGTAFITVVAGPATRWAEVRETMRQDGIIEASRAAPEALDEMLNAPGVRVGPDGEAYPAVILTPTADGIRADGILAEGTGDVLRHGLAWLGGDFRDGPSEPITTADTIMLESEQPISLEFDGELDAVASPAKFSLGSSAVDFIATA
ncbi:MULTISPECIES: diacylglycerol/lipid kinase family protein [unclassified Sphingopyxis]|jgi:diacylglycerol kinase family enzyme|uniref:diacylglycerol/lipid kinase family protein n=1 Tax=unclassified Sphingopyxis TaxID=2614943 RepID=UPI0025FA882D|nr:MULTISPECIES: diacylglycerol kinase family protein [unclassified Sphingopyxis]